MEALEEMIARADSDADGQAGGSRQRVWSAVGFESIFLYFCFFLCLFHGFSVILWGFWWGMKFGMLAVFARQNDEKFLF